MKFDELFNKIMDKFEVVTEQDDNELEDLDRPDPTGESSGEVIKDLSNDPLDMQLTINAGPGSLIEPNEKESDIDKELVELDKIKTDAIENEKENRINTLVNLIKQSEDNIERYKIIQNNSVTPETLAICNDFLQNEIPRLDAYKNELATLKPKKARKTSETSKLSEPEKNKESKSEEKEAPKKEEKKEEKSEEKKEEKKETKDESVKQSGNVITEAKKPIGTEFYLTELN